MSNQSVTTATNTAPQSRPARKAQPSPFIGAASIILGTGSVVLSLIGRALKESFKLLLNTGTTRRVDPGQKRTSVVRDARDTY